MVVLDILTPSTNEPRLSDAGRGVFVLLPVLNEIANLGPLLDKISAALAGSDYTIGLLDDGSKDGTVEYIRERMRQPQHRLHLTCRKKTLRASQRGSALRTLMLWGLDNTRHGIFVEMDGDLSHRPEELADGIRKIASGQWDVAIASKYVVGSEVVNRPWGRRVVSKVCSYAVRSLISRSVRDYSNGYRFYTREAARLAAEHSYRYGSPIYLSEILALWLRSGLRVTEIKSVYIGRNEGVSKLRIPDLVKASIAIFEIAARYHVLGFARRPASLPCPAEQSFKAAKE
jgi:dolichol-phosphate mannosyltransferase